MITSSVLFACAPPRQRITRVKTTGFAGGFDLHGFNRNIHPEADLVAVIVRSADEPALAGTQLIRQSVGLYPTHLIRADIALFPAVVFAENIHRFRVNLCPSVFKEEDVRQFINGHADSVLFFDIHRIAPRRRGFRRLLIDRHGQRRVGRKDDIRLARLILLSLLEPIRRIAAPALWSSPRVEEEPDYTENKAFAELVSRKDFLDCLEKYAKSLPADCEIEGMTAPGNALAKILKQPSVAELMKTK